MVKINVQPLSDKVLVQQIEEECREIKKATGVFPNELRIDGHVYKLRLGYYEKQLGIDFKGADGEKKP